MRFRSSILLWQCTSSSLSLVFFRVCHPRIQLWLTSQISLYTVLSRYCVSAERPNLSSGAVVVFVSNLLCSKLQGGMKVYICQHDTAPPGLFSSSKWPALSTDICGCGFCYLFLFVTSVFHGSLCFPFRWTADQNWFHKHPYPCINSEKREGQNRAEIKRQQRQGCCCCCCYSWGREWQTVIFVHPECY